MEQVELFSSIGEAIKTQSPYLVVIAVFMWDKVQQARREDKRTEIEQKKEEQGSEVMKRFTDTLQELKETVSLLKERISLKK